MGRVFIIGVGMTKFEKPGKRKDEYPAFAKEAICKAIEDSGVKMCEVEAAVAGYVYGNSTSGQRAIYEVGMTGIPIFNVNNNGASGGTALLLARDFIQSGKNECVLAVGFDKMDGLYNIPNRTNPLDKHLEYMDQVGDKGKPLAIRVFGNAAIEHMNKYGTKKEHFAKIAYKNHKHSVNNPYAQFRKEFTLEQIMKSPAVHGPLTALQCCPLSDGGAAVIMASLKFVKEHGLEAQAVEVLGMEMATDVPETFANKSIMTIAGYDMTKAAADRLFCKANCNPCEVQVVELDDAFSSSELITYEALGLCPPGKAGEFIDAGDNTYGGRVVVNPSGGLTSKGHPLGATGVSQCVDLCWQLRGLGGAAQVPGAKLALQHSYGMGSAVVVGLYKMGFPECVNQKPAMNKVSATEESVPQNPEYRDLTKKPFTSLPILRVLGDIMSDESTCKYQGTYAIKIKKPHQEGYYDIYFKISPEGVFEFNKSLKPDITFSAHPDDLDALLLGKMDPIKAYLLGRIKITGNISNSCINLTDIQKFFVKQIEQPQIFSSVYYLEMIDNILSQKFSETYPGVYGVKVRKPDELEYWDFYFRIAPGVIEINKKLKPTISYAAYVSDFDDLLLGKLEPIMAYFLGTLKITGNMTIMNVVLTDIQNFIGERLIGLKPKL